MAEWVDAQNKVTFGYLKKIPQRKALQKRITDLWNYERFSAPFKEGGKYFYFRNDGLQNQAVPGTMDKLDDEPRLLLDPNKLSKDGTVALSGEAVSPDGKLLAIGLAEAGSDWQSWKVLDIASGKMREDDLKVDQVLELCLRGPAMDSKGFFYSRFDEPKAGDKFTSLNFNQKLYYHRLRHHAGRRRTRLPAPRPAQECGASTAELSNDGRYLIISIRKGTVTSRRVPGAISLQGSAAEPYGMPTDLSSRTSRTSTASSTTTGRSSTSRPRRSQGAYLWAG